MFQSTPDPQTGTQNSDALSFLSASVSSDYSSLPGFSEGIKTPSVATNRRRSCWLVLPTLLLTARPEVGAAGENSVRLTAGLSAQAERWPSTSPHVWDPSAVKIFTPILLLFFQTMPITFFLRLISSDCMTQASQAGTQKSTVAWYSHSMRWQNWYMYSLYDICGVPTFRFSKFSQIFIIIGLRFLTVLL